MVGRLARRIGRCGFCCWLFPCSSRSSEDCWGDGCVGSDRDGFDSFRCGDSGHLRNDHLARASSIEEAHSGGAKCRLLRELLVSVERCTNGHGRVHRVSGVRRGVEVGCRWGGWGVNDDAGNEVRILNPSGFAEWPVKGDRRIALLITRVWFLQRRGAQKWQRWMPIVTFGSLLLLPFLLVFLPRGLSRGSQGGLFVLAFTPVLGALAFFQWKAWRGGLKSVVEWILAEGLCPSCGYNLHGLAADAGGCVACSECGAAWKRERILRSAAFEEGAEMGRAPLRLGSPRYQGSWTRDAIGGVVIVPMGLFTSATTDERLSD